MLRALVLTVTAATFAAASVAIPGRSGDPTGPVSDVPSTSTITTEEVTDFGVVRSGATVWIVDVGARVVDEVTVDPAATISHPRSQLLSFVGADEIEQLDLATGELTSVSNRLGRPVVTVDDQRLGYTTRPRDGAGGVADEPGPEFLDGMVDVITGDTVDLDAVFDEPEVVATSDLALLVADPAYTGLVVIRLDRAFEGVVELPTADPADVLFGQDGRGFAVLTDAGELVTGDALDVVASGVTELVGDIPGAVVARVGGDLAVIDGYGVVSDLPAELDDAEVVGTSGLFRVDGDEAAWYRVDLAGDVRPLDRVAGMDLIAAGDRAWWFATGDLSAPFSGSPVVAVDAADGSTVDVAGSLAALAALATTGTMSPTGRYLNAPFPQTTGFTGLAIADGDDGTVRDLDMLEPPLVFSPAPYDGSILSSTVAGPAITTIEALGGNTLVTRSSTSRSRPAPR